MPLIAKSTPAAPSTRRKTSLKTLIRKLDEGTPEARRKAALELVDTPDARNALTGRLAREEDTGVRAAIIDALLSIADAGFVDLMITLLRDDNAQYRNEAVTALQRISDLTSARMQQLLTDPDPDVRILAVDVLRLLPSPEVPGWLADLLERETHENVVGTAIDRLAEIGGPEHLDVLQDVRDRFAAVPYITFATDLVISRIKADAAKAEGSP